MIPPKIGMLTKEYSVVCMQARRLGRAQLVPPTKNRKLLGFGLLFLMNPAILFRFFGNYFILFQYSRQEGGGAVPEPRKQFPAGPLTDSTRWRRPWMIVLRKGEWINKKETEGSKEQKWRQA